MGLAVFRRFLNACLQPIAADRGWIVVGSRVVCHAARFWVFFASRDRFQCRVALEMAMIVSCAECALLGIGGISPFLGCVLSADRS